MASTLSKLLYRFSPAKRCNYFTFSNSASPPLLLNFQTPSDDWIIYISYREKKVRFWIFKLTRGLTVDSSTDNCFIIHRFWVNFSDIFAGGRGKGIFFLAWHFICWGRIKIANVYQIKHNLICKMFWWRVFTNKNLYNLFR